MGGGGLTSAIWTYSDGTILARTDTYGAYLYSPLASCPYGSGGSTFSAPCWKQLVTATSMPSAFVTVQTSAQNSMGTAEVVACPSNTNVLYMIFANTLFVSTNKGTTWVATTQTTSQNSNADPPKSRGPFLACDPNNPDVLYMGVNNKVVFTINGRSGASATFTTETDVGTTGSIPSIIAFDPNSTTTTCSGVTCSNHLWVFASGTGVFETTNGGQAAGGSFSATSGGPSTYYKMVADKFSQLWAVNNSTSVFKYVNGTGWSSTTVSPAQNIESVAVDPNSSTLGTNHVIAVQTDSSVLISTNNGSTFSGDNFSNPNTFAAPTGQPGWLGNAAQNSSPGSAVPSTDTFASFFDTSSNLWISGGISVWKTPATVAGPPTPYSANTVGIEQLVTNVIIAPAGNSPLTAVWDRGAWLIKNPDVFPSIQFPNSTSINQIQAAWGMDWASATPNFITAFIHSNQDSTSAMASSSDGGNTWTAMANNPTNFNNGGVIAASTTTNWVVISAAQGSTPTLEFTTNGASSAWTASTVSGSPTWLNSEFNNRQPLCADRVNANTFYVMDESQNVYSSTNSGSSFTKVNATSPPVDGTVFRDVMTCVPGQAGNLFYTAGGGLNTTHPVNSHLWKSTNAGVNWADVNANLKEVQVIGFGAPQPGGGGYPMIYVSGWLSGVQGFYSSADGGTTWVSLNVPTSQQVWPVNSIDELTAMSGDMDVYGRVYVGFLGSGAAYIDTADACPWVKFSNTNPNASLTGTVTLSAQQSGLVPITAVDFYVDGTLIGRQTTGTGTPSTYSQSWVTGGVIAGAHTLKVLAEGSTNALCSTSLTTGNSQSIPITTH